MMRSTKTPLSTSTTLAFLSDRVVRVLKNPVALGPDDHVVLQRAQLLVASARTGSQLIRDKDYRAAAARSFADFAWAAPALNAIAAKHVVSKSIDSDVLLTQIYDTMAHLREGRDVDSHGLDVCREFFHTLRQVVLDNWSRPTDRAERK